MRISRLFSRGYPKCNPQIVTMKMQIGPYSIIFRKNAKEKKLDIDISGKKVTYRVLGESLTLLDGSVPEDLRPQLEKTIKIHFRTKV